MNQADQYVKGEWWIVNGTPHPLSLSPRRGEGGYVTRNTFQVSFQLIPTYSSLFQRIFFWETRIAPMKANFQPQNPSQPSPWPNDFPSPPWDGCPKYENRLANRGPLGGARGILSRASTLNNEPPTIFNRPG